MRIKLPSPHALLVASITVAASLGCGDSKSGAPADGGIPDGGVGDAPCASDADCEAGRCVNLTQSVGAATGYCSLSCEVPEDCVAMADGQSHVCVGLGSDLGQRCVRVCDDGFGCGLDSDLCTEFPLGGVTLDVCLDTRRIACTADRDCEAGRFCTPVADREAIHPICLPSRAPEGAPTPFEPDRLAVGGACDPAAEVDGPAARFCDAPEDCPNGACWRRADRESVCFPPANERCALFCNAFGQCAGLCDEDEDCPADMRCSRITTTLGQADPDAYDDTWLEQGLCTYAAGSRAPCARELDCASTGPGGSAEACVPGTTVDGTVSSICVTPSPGVGLPGDSCGDDPVTDVVEVGECHGSCESLRCGAVCDGDGDCPDGTSCRAFLLDARRQARFCAVVPNCVRDADCALGEACVPTASATDFEGRCEPRGGGLDPGSECVVPGDGAALPYAERCSLGCLDVSGASGDGRCTAACAADEDCPGEDFACVLEERTLVSFGTLAREDDTTAPLRFCRYLPGRGRPCARAMDCGPGQTCATWRSVDGAAVTRCIDGVDGGASAGASCRGAPCEDRLCFPDWREPDFPYCATLCVGDADCPTGTVCRIVNGVDAAASTQQCIRPDDPRAVR